MLTAMSDVVDIRGLGHSYGDRPALVDVNLRIGEGESFGLLGPNGSGKTTLFRILATLLRPAHGTASICGCDVSTEQEAVRGNIGVIFQSPGLDPYLTARENLLHHGHLYGLAGPELDRRIGESLQTLGVADRANDLVKTLSGGLRRRVELAKCLVHRPKVLILDEPSTGLDPRGRQELWRSLERLREETGVTVLLTTHYMDEAERCGRLAILDRGRLVATGTPVELKSRVGCECVTIESDDAAALRSRISAALAIEPRLLNGTLRIETGRGAALGAELMQQFGGEIRTLAIGRPTLEDVFIHETGHRFESEEAGA